MEVEQYRREREQEFQSKQQAVSPGEVRMGGQGCKSEVHLVRCVCSYQKENKVAESWRGPWQGPQHLSSFMIYKRVWEFLKEMYSLCVSGETPQSVRRMVTFGVWDRGLWSWVVR